MLASNILILSYWHVLNIQNARFYDIFTYLLSFPKKKTLIVSAVLGVLKVNTTKNIHILPLLCNHKMLKMKFLLEASELKYSS